MERDDEQVMWDNHERVQSALDEVVRVLYYHKPAIGAAVMTQLADRIEAIAAGLRKEAMRQEQER